eukprot:1143892-Pelagomonas_calceolata.AAC.13
MMLQTWSAGYAMCKCCDVRQQYAKYTRAQNARKVERRTRDYWLLQAHLVNTEMAGPNVAPPPFLQYPSQYSLMLLVQVMRASMNPPALLYMPQHAICLLDTT